MTAYVFPGQGSQSVGMGKDLYDRSHEARSWFELANKILGFSISEVIFEGTEAQLQQTNITQPAIFIHSFVSAKLVPDFQPKMVAGHSLGEFSALAAIHVLDFEEGLKLVMARASLMQEACEKEPGTMVAVLGLSDQVVQEVCDLIPDVVIPANYNAPGQLVIAGTLDGIDKACERLQQLGAKLIRLKVSGAFHSPLMNSAKDRLAKLIDDTSFQQGMCPIYQNVTAQPVSDPALIKRQLIEQLVSPLLWTQTVLQMVTDGATSFVACGPGKVLQSLIKKIAPQVEVS